MNFESFERVFNPSFANRLGLSYYIGRDKIQRF